MIACFGLPSRRTAILAVDSVLAYALGYVVSIFVYDLGLFAFGLAANTQPTLFHDDVLFGASGENWVWLGGVVVVVLFGIAMLSIFQGESGSSAAARLIVLWLLIHAFREAATRLLDGYVRTDSDVRFAADSLGLSPLWISGALGAAGLVAIGALAVPSLLRLAPDQTAIVKTPDRFAFVAWLTFPAWILGSLISLLFFLPGSGVDPLLGLPTAGIVVGAAMLVSVRRRVLLPDDPDVSLAWWLLPVLAAAWVVSYVFLVDGISLV